MVIKMIRAFMWGVVALLSPLTLAQTVALESTQRLPQWTESYSLQQAANRTELRVHGLNPEMTMGFGGRYDRIVTDAELTLAFAVSPAMVDTVSQLRVSMNRQVIGVLPLRKSMSERPQRQKLKVDPRLFSRYNELTIELISEVALGQCTLASPAAWVEFLEASELTLTYQQLKVANELAFFPEPWFDKNDFNPVQLHFVTTNEITLAQIESHAVLASYFGKEANWRPFTVSKHQLAPRSSLLDDERWRNDWPKAHAVMTLTNDQRPWPLHHLPKVSEPQVSMIDNPAHPAYKVLLISAQDDQQLRAAVQTFVLSNKGMSGNKVSVNPQNFAARDAYQAPRWVNIDKPLTLSSLVDHPSELQRSARNNTPINIDLRMPPDLFKWQRHGIPIDLKFRYTPPVDADDSRLLVSVNNEFVKGFNLNPSGNENTVERVRIPILDGNLLADTNLQLPSFKLDAINQLRFEFSFGMSKDVCKTLPLLNARGAIDGSSTIDLSGYEHYVALPDTHLFIKTGYPFTRWDDLSQTQVVVPENMSADVYQTLLQLIAKFSAATGYPATQLNLVTVADAQESDRDILIVGQQALQGWLEKFGDRQLLQQLSTHNVAATQQLLYQPGVALENTGPSAAVIGFQSPFEPNRSVVAVTATTDSYLTRIREVLRNDALSSSFSGAMSVITPARVDTYAAVTPYYVGTLGWWNKLLYHLAKYPLVVTILGILMLFVLVLALYRLFAARAQARKASLSQ